MRMWLNDIFKFWAGIWVCCLIIFLTIRYQRPIEHSTTCTICITGGTVTGCTITESGTGYKVRK